MAKVKTNADRIRSMTDEELIDFIFNAEVQKIDYGISFCGAECDEVHTCKECIKAWLKKPYESKGFYEGEDLEKDDF